MMDDNKNYFRYTSCQRIYETERLKYQEILKDMKNKNSVIEEETKLSNYNSKSCIYSNFKNYIKTKLEINGKLEKFYNQIKLRKFKWRQYINKQRTESKLVNNIKNNYETKDKKPAIVIGNWNITKQMRNFISTPCIGIKRLLSKNFKVVTIDEFRTSCLDYKTEDKVKNMRDINNKKIHSVLILTEKNRAIGCINRDKNAVLNYQKIVKQYMNDRTRPYNFRRDVELKS